MHLAKYARSVTMLVRDKALAASMSQYLSERILGATNVRVQYDVEITGLDGGQALERIRIRSRPGMEAQPAGTPTLLAPTGRAPTPPLHPSPHHVPPPPRYSPPRPPTP